VLAFSHVLHYLDDFLAILISYEEAFRYNAAFDALYMELGLSVNHKKDVIGRVTNRSQLNSVLSVSILCCD